MIYQIKEDLNIALKSVYKAGKKIIRDFHEIGTLQVSRKGVADFVTHADFKVEKTLITYLQSLRNEYGILTEESGEIEPIKKPRDNSIYKWIVDPIDGTFNFMHAIPYFCISIALTRENKDGIEILLGVIHNPITNETFWAIKNFGAFCEHHPGQVRRIKVSGSTDLEKTICIIYERSREIPTIQNQVRYMIQNRAKIRIFGSTALELAHLAEGKVNLMIQNNVNFWDYAAGTLIVQEAGGTVQGLDNKHLNLRNKRNNQEMPTHV